MKRHNKEFPRVTKIYAIWNNETNSFHRDEYGNGHRVLTYTSRKTADTVASALILSPKNARWMAQDVKVVEFTVEK